MEDWIEGMARDGYRMEIIVPGEKKTKVLWAGLGNRSGLHGFADTLLREKWEKSGERMLKRFRKLTADHKIVLLQYRNTTRDRGKWVKVKTVRVKPAERIYPDTAAGARAYLAEDSIFDKKLIASAEVIRDPMSDGVWCLLGVADAIDGPDAVVYLAGYDDPWGQERKTNDFEACGYLPGTIPMKDR